MAKFVSKQRICIISGLQVRSIMPYKPTTAIAIVDRYIPSFVAPGVISISIRTLRMLFLNTHLCIGFVTAGLFRKGYVGKTLHVMLKNCPDRRFLVTIKALEAECDVRGARRARVPRIAAEHAVNFLINGFARVEWEHGYGVRGRWRRRLFYFGCDRHFA